MKSFRTSVQSTIKEFVIPMKKDDLLASHAGRYTVEQIIPLRIVSQSIDATRAALQSNGASFILDNFDTFFSVLVHGNKVELPIVIRGFKRIIKAIGILVDEMEKLHDRGQEMENEERLKYCCITKMLAYLFTSFIVHINERTCLESNSIETTGKRKRTARSDAEEQWEDQKQSALELLYRWIQLPLPSLWQPPIAEDSFISIVTQACYKILERSKDNKQKNIRQTIFEILGTLVKRYNHGLTCVVKLIQLIQLNEALALPIAHGVIHMVNHCDCKGFIQKIIQEIGHSEPGESDSRNISVFLETIANTQPHEIVPIIGNLQDHLASEHYTMRNCVIGVLGVVVQKSLTGEDLTDEQKLLRDESLDNLEEHILDCNAYVRSKVLQVWQRLCCEGAVPLARQGKLVKAAAARLVDKSAIVRKQALQLLRALLQGNPFAGKLDSAEISKCLETERQKLKDLHAAVASTSERGDDHRAEIWNTLMPQIRKALKKIIEDVDDEDEDEDDDDDDDDDKEEKERNNVEEKEEGKINKEKKEEEAINPDFAFENVRQLMLNEKVYEAVSYLWRVCTKLEQAPDMNNLKPQEKEECLFMFLLKIFMESEDESIAEKLGKNSKTEKILTEEERKQREEIKTLKRFVGYLENSLEFATELEKAIPLAENLLFSITAGDAVEACTLLGIASKFGVAGATNSIRKALFQVFHREPSVRENLGLVYKDIYFVYTQQENTARQKASACAKRLMLLVKELQPGESPALAQLMVNWYNKKELSNDVLQILWEKFSMKSSETTVVESRAALALITMIAQAQNDIIIDNFDALFKVGFGTLGNNNLLLARDTCRALLKIKYDFRDMEKAPIKYDNKNEMFEKILTLLIENFSSLKNDGYISFATDAINVIYHLANKPEHLSKEILTKIWNDENFVKTGDNGSPVVSMFLLSKFLYILGHIAIRQMVYMDTSVYKELKRRNFLRESKKDSKNKKNTSILSHKSLLAVNQTPNSAGQMLRSKEVSTLLEDNGEEALNGAADDADAEFINDTLEREIVTGNGMLVQFVPLVLDVCQHPEKYDTEQVQAAGVLALSKMMTVSSMFCEESLQLLVTILERSPYPGIRANVLIGLSDLTIRFPNQVEPWTKHIYSRLRDEDTHVRTTCVRMLSSLIMREMVRVKGQVSELALCIVDKDLQISQHTREFFRVLSLKGNTLYNVMPDILSRLVDPELQLEEPVFQEIIKFILGLVQKERQVDTIIEKVCARFKLATTERQWRDLSYCLSLLQFSVKSLRRLIESLPLLKEKIHYKEVLRVLHGIIEQCKKKTDLKTVAIELEGKINDLLNGDQSTEPSDSQIMPPPTAPVPKKPSRKGSRKKILSSSDEDSDDDVKVKPLRKTRSVKRKSMGNGENSSSDSDSDIENIPIKTPSKQTGKRMLSKTRGAKTPNTTPSPMAKRNKSAKTPQITPSRASSRLLKNK